MDSPLEAWIHLKTSEFEDEAISVVCDQDAWLAVGLTTGPTVDVSYGMRSNEMINALGDKLGGSVKHDDEVPLMLEEAIRIRVRMNVLKPLLRRVAIKSGDRNVWVAIRYERVPMFCYCCGRIGHQLKDSTGEVAKTSPHHQVQFGSWMHAPKTSRLDRTSKIENEREKSWLETLKRHSMAPPTSKVSFNDTGKATHSGDFGNGSYENGPTMEKASPQFMETCEVTVHHSLHVHTIETLLVSQLNVYPLSTHIGAQVFIENNSNPLAPPHHTLHVLKSNNNTGDATMSEARACGDKRMAESIEAASSSSLDGCDVFLVVVCIVVMRWISGLILDSDESDRDFPIQCFSESKDPSVDGCSYRQRSLKGGWTETLNATDEILSLWEKDDYLICLVLNLYFDIYCNFNIFV